ncbi:MAG: amidohydrolase family protein [Vicinamibacterales bacterium]
MKTALLTALALAASVTTAAAQNLVITNARILDGKGGEIPRGSIVVRDGKIASVAAGAPAAVPGARVIDAQGRTVMPGFIDAHRHIIGGGFGAEQQGDWMATEGPRLMQQFLDAGFTTVLSAGDDAAQILELRRRTADGSIKGPRIFAAGRVGLAARGGGPAPAAAAGGRQRGAGPGAQPPAAGGGGRRGDPARFDVSRPPLRPTAPAGRIPPEETIAAVENVAKQGFDYIKTAITVTPGGPEVETLKLVVAEGRKRNLPTITHAVTVEDTLGAVDAAPAVLVHSPHIGRLEENPDAVQKIAKAGIPMTSTLAIFIPHFDENNQPLFRDRQPFPWDTISSAGQGPVNVRLLWEAGISYGYGTDTSWPPRDQFRDELRALQLVFSGKDIVKIMGIGAAKSVLKDSELGTLEPGKLADIVIVNGDPHANPFDLLNVATTIKGGVVMSER